MSDLPGKPVLSSKALRRHALLLLASARLSGLSAAAPPDFTRASRVVGSSEAGKTPGESFAKPKGKRVLTQSTRILQGSNVLAEDF